MSNPLIEVLVFIAAFATCAGIMFAVMWVSTKNIPGPEEKRNRHAKKSESGKN